MNIFNSIKSFLHIGNNQQTIINNVDIKPISNIIQKDFFDGNIKKSLNDLEDLLKKYTNNQEVLYELLLLKVNFNIYLQKIEDSKNLLNYIESNYPDFLDIRFDELKLTLLSIDNKKNKYNNLANKLTIEQSITKDYFEMLYLINQNRLEEAEKIYKILEDVNKFNILYNGFIIYSKLYEYSQDKKYLDKALDIHEKLKNLKVEFNFFEKLSIDGFYGLSLINSFLMNKNLGIDYNIDNYKKIIEIIIDNENSFDKSYFEKIINIYLYILLYKNNIDNYLKFSNKYKEKLSNFHFFHYLHYSKEELNHTIFQKKANYNSENLIFYISLLFEDITLEDKNKIKELLQSQSIEKILKYDYIIYIFSLNIKNIPNKIKNYVKQNKNKNLYLLLSYINLFGFSNKYTQELIKLAKEEKHIFGLVYDSMKILVQNKKITQYLELTLHHKDKFKNIIFETLKIIYNDNNILYSEFVNFIQKIDIKKEHYAIIGNIFVKYEKNQEAFEYFWNVYQDDKDNIEIIIALLQLIWNYYNISNEILDNNKQNELFSKLSSQADNLNLEDTIFLFYYSLGFIKDTNQAIYFLNIKLLKEYKNISNEILGRLHNLFLLRYEKNYNELFLVENNKCLIKNENIYIKSNFDISKFNIHLNIKKINAIEYLSLKQENIEEESFLHIILSSLIFKKNNPNIFSLKIDYNKDNPFQDLFDFIEQTKIDEINFFQNYSNGNNSIGLYPLAKKDYKNYFTLIPYLLASNYNFNSLKLNYMVNRPKILTLSSIVLLNEINLLDKVLKNKNIVIQKSLVNWLYSYIEKLEYNTMPLDYKYLDNKKMEFTPYTQESIKQTNDLKIKLINLLNKLNKYTLIDDHLEHLPIKEAFNTISPLVGFQEYWAFVYSINHNYQIISENNIFDFLFEHFNFNKQYISNILSILDYDDYLYAVKILKKKRYKSLVSNSIEKMIITLSKHYNLLLTKDDIFIIKIANQYGYLENIKKYYYNKFHVLYPKVKLPTKTFFDLNIEKIINCTIENK